MQKLLAILVPLALCACASDNGIGSRQLIQVGESCAAIGKGIKVANWQAAEEPPNFLASYRIAEPLVTCR